jgi:hypothetical protein
MKMEVVLRVLEQAGGRDRHHSWITLAFLLFYLRNNFTQSW